MVFTVHRRGQVVGTVNVTEHEHKIEFEVCCICDTAEILRCYGQTGVPGKPLLIGVLEPREGALRLTRVLTRQAMAAWCEEVPTSYYLFAGEEDEPSRPPSRPTLKTGDALLDAAIAGGSVRAEQTEEGVTLRCTFSGTEPFALAFAAVVCTVEEQNGEYVAVLKI